MSEWARGAWAIFIGAFLLVFSYFVTIHGGRLLIPLFGRPVAEVFAYFVTVAALVVFVAGVVLLLRGLARRTPSSS